MVLVLLFAATAVGVAIAKEWGSMLSSSPPSSNFDIDPTESIDVGTARRLRMLSLLLLIRLILVMLLW